MFLDYIHDDGVTADVMIPCGSERQVDLAELSLPQFSWNHNLANNVNNQNHVLQAAATNDTALWEYLTPCCLCPFTRCEEDTCMGLTCRNCGNSRLKQLWPSSCVTCTPDGERSPFNAKMCTCCPDVE